MKLTLENALLNTLDMRLIFYFTLLLTFRLVLTTTKYFTLDYYLPQNVTYKKNIPTPKSIFNFDLGCTDHTQLAYYMGRLQKHLIELKLKLPGIHLKTDHYSLLFRVKKSCANKRN
jgi:hypothetical protein